MESSIAKLAVKNMTTGKVDEVEARVHGGALMVKMRKDLDAMQVYFETTHLLYIGRTGFQILTSSQMSTFISERFTRRIYWA